ncbi:MAG TPA: YceI family protein [Puia sp.]|jgi:polyisoprenoid-binding protein YceI|nr:YceI family protein [Puia sp.]
MQISAILLTGLVLVGFVETWKADPSKAKVQFSVHGPFGTVHGSFTGLKASIQFDEQHPGSGSISATIDPNTVSTGIGMRNHDLKHEEKWLNTAKYPTISFRSTHIERTSKGFEAAGDLTLKGVTKPVRIPFTFSPSGNSGLFKGEFVIHREDFGVGGKGGSVGNDITISLEVPVTK